MLELPGRSARRRKREMTLLMQLYKGPAFARGLHEATDIPESTIHRILETMEKIGMVTGVKTPDRGRIIETSQIKAYNLDHSGGNMRVYGGPIAKRYSLAGKYMEAVRLYCSKNEFGEAAQQKIKQCAFGDDAY